MGVWPAAHAQGLTPLPEGSSLMSMNFVRDTVAACDSKKDRLGRPKPMTDTCIFKSRVVTIRDPGVGTREQIASYYKLLGTSDEAVAAEVGFVIATSAIMVNGAAKASQSNAQGRAAAKSLAGEPISLFVCALIESIIIDHCDALPVQMDQLLRERIQHMLEAVGQGEDEAEEGSSSKSAKVENEHPVAAGVSARRVHVPAIVSPSHEALHLPIVGAGETRACVYAVMSCVMCTRARTPARMHALGAVLDLVQSCTCT